MEPYLLLRNNTQTGPYSFQALTKLGLQPMDLIWIEGKSTAWQYPTEIAALKPHVQAPAPRTYDQYRPGPAAEATNVFVQLPANFFRKRHLDEAQAGSGLPIAAEQRVLETNICQTVEALREKARLHQPPASLWRSSRLAVRPLVGMAALLGGLLFGAVVIKRIVDYAVAPPRDIPVAYAQAAPGTAPEAPADFQNAVTREVEPVAEKKAVKKEKPRDIREQVKLKGSDYKKGVLGGIRDLKLSVTNRSPHLVDKVNIAVEYRKANGSVIHTEYVDLSALRPGATRSVSVPPSKRGVDVSYKITNIRSAQYRSALREG